MKESFIEYVNKIIDISFYDFCRLHLRKVKLNEHELEKEIVKEIRESDTECDENDLEDADFIYNWYLRDRVEYSLSEDLDFFLDII